MLRPKFDRYVAPATRQRFPGRLVGRDGTGHDHWRRSCLPRSGRRQIPPQTAINGQADCLVTGDADFLVLDPFQGVRILTPRNFLDLVRRAGERIKLTTSQVGTRRWYPQAGNFGSHGKMDKCTFCGGGPEEDMSQAEFQKYGRNRLAEGKLPLCAEMCATNALLGGDGDVISDIYRERVVARDSGSGAWGLGTAYQLKGGA